MNIKNAIKEWDNFSEEEKWQSIAELCGWDTLRWEREFWDDGLEHKVLRGVNKSNRVVRNVPNYLKDLNAIVKAVNEEEDQHNECWAQSYTFRLLDVSAEYDYDRDGECSWDDIHSVAQSTSADRTKALYLTIIEHKL